MHQEAADFGEEQHQRRRQGHRGVNGVPEGGGGRVAQDQVPDDAAAHSGGQGQDAHAEDVHVLFDAGHGPGGRESHGAHQLEDQNENIHPCFRPFLSAPSP